MSSNPLRHALSRMGGRDPHEKHRTATPLELFFDLTFVIAFGVAGSQFAHAVAEAHFWPGLLAFSFAMFAVIWAWINFTWFASAYDTDDWVFRVVTMVQMVGVLILAMGIEPMFHSHHRGQARGQRHHGARLHRHARGPDLPVAARGPPGPRTRGRPVCATRSTWRIVQIGWVAVLVVDANVLTTFLMAAPLFIMEMAAPYFAERKIRTPWHAHHIAERYGLLAIIALGECLIGAIETLRAIVATHSWSMDAALVGLSGTGLAFAMWWIYFILPSGPALHVQRHRSWVFGYGHMPIFAAIAATGAGLHVAAYFIDHEAHIPAAAAVASIAIPDHPVQGLAHHAVRHHARPGPRASLELHTGGARLGREHRHGRSGRLRAGVHAGNDAGPGPVHRLRRTTRPQGPGSGTPSAGNRRGLRHPPALRGPLCAPSPSHARRAGLTTSAATRERSRPAPGSGTG